MTEEGEPTYSARGPFSYENWLHMTSGGALRAYDEFPLYTDVRLTGTIERVYGVNEYGPYEFVNMLPMLGMPPDQPRVTLRIANHFPDWEAQSKSFSFTESDTSTYHGGTMVDEVSSLASLLLGIRLKPGPCSREFDNPAMQPMGRPVSGRGWEKVPMLLVRQDRPMLPRALGERSLNDMSLLTTLPTLKARDVVALVRASRLYQDSVWIAEVDPAQAWLMLVSAIEVVAAQFDDVKLTDDEAIERMEDWRRGMKKLLEVGGRNLQLKVARKLSGYIRPGLKFERFIIDHLPDVPPHSRIEEFAQHSWDTSTMLASVRKIYEHRSNALHGGTPFPFPMCQPPPGSLDRIAERPFALAHESLGSYWVASDVPMYLQTFEYIVRGALLNWWRGLVQ